MIKKLNLRTQRVEEGAEIKTKCIENLFKEFIGINFPNLGKDMDIQVKDEYKTPNRCNQERAPPHHIIVKMLKLSRKERILKSAKEKCRPKNT
jgi:hypothetical protein